jgi:HlyD family secretion protein
MTATVRVEIARADDVLKVPTSALRFTPDAAAANAESRAARGGDQGRVWVLDHDQPRAVRVRPGITDGATTALLDAPLQEGDRVITGSAGSGPVAQSSSPFIPQRRGGGGAAASRGQVGGRSGGANR